MEYLTKQFLTFILFISFTFSATHSWGSLKYPLYYGESVVSIEYQQKRSKTSAPNPSLEKIKLNSIKLKRLILNELKKYYPSENIFQILEKEVIDIELAKDTPLNNKTQPLNVLVKLKIVSLVSEKVFTPHNVTHIKIKILESTPSGPQLLWFNNLPTADFLYFVESEIKMFLRHFSLIPYLKYSDNPKADKLKSEIRHRKFTENKIFIHLSFNSEVNSASNFEIQLNNYESLKFVGLIRQEPWWTSLCNRVISR